MKRMLRRAACLLLALALFMSGAQAAPCRDEREMTAASESLRALVSLFGAAALMKGADGLEEGAPADGPLVEGVLLLGLSRGLLPRVDGDPADGKETVSEETLNGYLAELFAAPAQTPESPACPCITRQGSSLTFDYSDTETETAGGARIYSAVRQNGRVLVKADAYATLTNWQSLPEEVAEDCLTWECAMSLTLEETASSRFGYRLVSFTRGPEWAFGALDTWRETAGDGYTLNLPEGAALLSASGGTDTYSLDGMTLTVERLVRGRQDPLSAQRTRYLAAHPDALVMMAPALSYATMEAPGEYAVVCAPEGSDTVYLLTLRFSKDRQEEGSFYGEILRNAFWASGIAAG